MFMKFVPRFGTTGTFFALGLLTLPAHAEEPMAANSEAIETEETVLASNLTVNPVYEQITILASARDVRSVAGSAQYVSELELERFDYQDINRILRSVPGINIQEEDGYGLRPNIGLRGTGLDRSSKIAVLEDGILAAPAPYAAPSAYYFPLAGRMQAVEIVKGTAAVKYGPLTTGGAINLQSTQIPPDDRLSLNAQYGSDAYWRLHSIGGTTRRLSSGAEIGLLAETFQTGSDGFKELDSGGNTGFDIQDWVGKISYTTSPGARLPQEFELKLQYSDEISDETYLGLTQADFDANPYRRYRGSQLDRMDTEHNIYQFTHRIDWAPSISMTSVVYRTDFQRNWFKLDKVVDAVQGSSSISSILDDPITFADAYATIVGAPGLVSPNDALQIKNNNRAYMAQGIQVVLGYETQIGATSHALEVSARYHEDEMDRFQWVDRFRMDNGGLVLTTQGIPGTDSNRIDSAEAWAFFLRDEITWNDWTFTPGVRHERIDLWREDFGKTDPGRTGASLVIKENEVDVWIPGFGITYQATPDIQLLAGAHKGFTHPSPGSTADAEESVNYEFGLRYNNGNLIAEAIAFFNDYSNLVGTCTASTGGICVIGDQFDGGEADVTGLELSGGYDFGRARDLPFGLPVSVAYTWTQAEFQNNFVSSFGPWGSVMAGDEMPQIPEHQINLSIGIEANRWRLNLNGNYIAETRSDAGQGAILASELIDDRFVVDASVEFELASGWALTASVQNLSDEVYVVSRSPAGLRPGKPQSFFVGFKAHL